MRHMCLQQQKRKKKSEIRKEIEPIHEMQLSWLGPLPSYKENKRRMCALMHSSTETPAPGQET